MNTVRLPAEWEPQDAILIAFPSAKSDWFTYWDDIISCYVNIIKVLASYQPLIIICDNEDELRTFLKDQDLSNIKIIKQNINDTWTRDYAAITVQRDEEFVLYDFMFNGWGLKFAADKDNQINKHLWETGLFNAKDIIIQDIVLEGGSIESDGKGTLMTTSNCLLSPNRNPHLSKDFIEEKMKNIFGLQQILWLENGHLVGDDTDSHIDTLARFCDENTIAYLQCTDPNAMHYADFKKMEMELKEFKTLDGKPYELVPLPLTEAIFAKDDNRQLPASYANFLIMNDVVLMPTYNVPQDAVALEQLQKAFSKSSKRVEGIDCRALILQHGSLHCITMQFPKGSIKMN